VTDLDKRWITPNEARATMGGPPDLETLIRERQDSLRGRPEDWIDRFGGWRRNADWPSIAIIAGGLLVPLLILFAVAWSL
jgi:hypothetical protein